MEYSSFGRHIAIDAYGVGFHVLNSIDLLEYGLVTAAELCGAEVLGVQSKKFEPNGVTVLVMLSESHISIHTYPQKGFAGIDCYTCGETVDPQIAIDYLINYLNVKTVYKKRLIRGIDENIRMY